MSVKQIPYSGKVSFFNDDHRLTYSVSFSSLSLEDLEYQAGFLIDNEGRDWVILVGEELEKRGVSVGVTNDGDKAYVFERAAPAFGDSYHSKQVLEQLKRKDW